MLGSVTELLLLLIVGTQQSFTDSCSNLSLHRCMASFCRSVGDFNFTSICWSSHSAPADGVHDTLLTFICDYGFSQMVPSPTRCHNILDLVLCNEPLLLSALYLSNHQLAKVTMTLSSVSCSDGMSVADPTSTCDDHPSLYYSYDWKKANYDGISRYLSQIDWQSVLSYNLTADSLWTAFTDVMRAAINMYVPAKTVKQKRNRPITSGLNAHLKHYPKPIICAMYRKMFVEVPPPVP